MVTYEETAEFILDVLKEDLNLNDKERIMERFHKIKDKYKYRPSSLVLSVIELEYPEKKKIIDLMQNVNRLTINSIKNEIE